jgi:hypothetical protein
MSDLVPINAFRRTGTESSLSQQMSLRSRRQLTRLEEGTLLRIAEVHADGIVQSEKMDEIDHLARQAKSGQAMLRKWADTLSRGDPLLRDELQHFADMASSGKQLILADAIEHFSREQRS